MKHEIRNVTPFYYFFRIMFIIITIEVLKSCSFIGFESFFCSTTNLGYGLKFLTVIGKFLDKDLLLAREKK